MFRIEPTTLYSRQDLKRELGGAMTVETFLEPLEIRHLYRKAYMGSEILEALERARDRTLRAAATACVPSGLSGRPRPARSAARLERVHIPRK
jgi:hypothetical protein